jgi:hypothetical protein
MALPRNSQAMRSAAGAIEAGLRAEKTMRPHLDAALNLGRWLPRSEHDTEDIGREA